MSGISPRQDLDRGSYTTANGNISYISGKHNLKSGIQFRTGYFQESFQMKRDLVQVLNSGKPVSAATKRNRLPRVSGSRATPAPFSVSPVLIRAEPGT